MSLIHYLVFDEADRMLGTTAVQLFFRDVIVNLLRISFLSF